MLGRYHKQSDVSLFFFLHSSLFLSASRSRRCATSLVGVDQDFPLGATPERDQSRERVSTVIDGTLENYRVNSLCLNQRIWHGMEDHHFSFP